MNVHIIVIYTNVWHTLKTVMSCENYDSFSTHIPSVTPADPEMAGANECFLSNAYVCNLFLPSISNVVFETKIKQLKYLTDGSSSCWSKIRNIYPEYSFKNRLILPECAMWLTDLTFYELAKSQAQEHEKGKWKRVKDFLAGIT